MLQRNRKLLRQDFPCQKSWDYNFLFPINAVLHATVTSLNPYKYNVSLVCVPLKKEEKKTKKKQDSSSLAKNICEKVTKTPDVFV